MLPAQAYLRLLRQRRATEEKAERVANMAKLLIKGSVN